MIYTCSVYAFDWNLFDCIQDPCNCGRSDVEEIWNDKPYRTIKPGTNCPPWNKFDGRGTDNCLIQFAPPSVFSQFYLNHCAESTKESTYFEPKIRIRTQSCNAFACWHQSTPLKWDGECVIWPGAYALPLLRICARVALPAVPPDPQGLNKSGTPADPGYTVGRHLNNVGFIEKDERFFDDEGKEIQFDRPKLCAYSDPGLVNLVSATGVHIDPFDWNPVSQPLHKTTALHPIIRALIFLTDQSSSLTVPALLEKLLDMIGAEDIPGLDVLLSIVKAIGKVYELFYSLITEVLKRVGSLNGSVDDYLFGCVELPFGPFPPPYCPAIAPFTPIPSLNLVCSIKRSDNSGFFDQSSTVSPCVVSTTPNNFVNNTVRISLDNLVPLCKGEDPLQTDKCVTLKNFPPSAKAFHTATVQRDLIKPCSGVTDSSVCVSTKLKHSCNISDTSLSGCQDGFRIVYAQKTGNRSVPTSYFNDDLADCNSSGGQNATTCQEVWGINTGQFVDLPLGFPLVQDQTIGSLLFLQRKVSLNDNVGKRRNFNVSIARVPTQNGMFDPLFLQDPNDICVAEDNSLVGCTARVKDGYRVSTYDCASAHDGAVCSNNSYFTPQFIASVEAVEKLPDGTSRIVNSTSTVVTPLSVNTNPQPPAGENKVIVNLAGFQFSAFMADIQTMPSKYIAAPFSGPNSLNPSTIHGTYKDGKVPYDSRGNQADGVVYLKGLEYINGRYIQGGNAGCLEWNNVDKCLPSINDTNCVLANLLEIAPVGTAPNGGCKNFHTKYRNLRICNSSDAGYCTTSSSWYDIKIYNCKNNDATWDCYENTKNPGVEVCQTSIDTANRSDPSPSLGPIINSSGQNYTITMKSDGTYPFNEDTKSVRDKTSQELGLCITIPPAFCPAITTPSESTGNVIWPRGEIGELVTGICPPGDVLADPSKPPQRYCLSDAQTKTVAFEQLTPGVWCREDTGLEYDFDRGTFTANYPVENYGYDKTTKIGKFLLGGDFALVNEMLCATYTFNIPSTDILEYFKIGVKNQDGNVFYQDGSSYYDDHLLVKVNDQVAYNSGISNSSPPKSFSKMSSTGSGASYKLFLDNILATDIGGKRVIPETDILSYLRNINNNKINICVGAVGGGSLYFTLEYKIK